MGKGAPAELQTITIYQLVFPCCTNLQKNNHLGGTTERLNNTEVDGKYSGVVPV